MATIRGISLKAILFLCLALLLYSAQGVFHRRNGGYHSGYAHGRLSGRGRHRVAPSLGTIFNVRSYGAKPDGRSDNTQAFMKAWNAACRWKGKARLLIPMGKFVVGQVAFQGPCSSSIPITVQVVGTLVATTDVSEFVSPEWFTFEHIKGLRVTGGGTFDGQGPSVWKYNDCHHKSDCQLLPTNIKFNGVTNGNVRGIKSLNSKSFHMHVTNCQNFGIQRIHITAPAESPNTDGIHISHSNQVRVSRSVIGTGDDCISIGQGATDISINKITCGPGHGISVGSLGKYQDEEDVRGVYVKNCTLLNTENGIRIKTWPGSPPSQASNFIFQDIVMKNVENPIIIDQDYCASKSCTKEPSRVKISDVHYINIRGTSATKIAVNLVCSQQVPCQNVQLLNINLKFNGDRARGLAPTASSLCTNAKVGFGGMQIPPPCR